MGEFEERLAAREATERRAHSVGVGEGWRSVLERYLGDGEGRLGFFKTLSIALGHAARTDEPIEEIVSVTHAIIVAHPDFNAERAGQYTSQKLHAERRRFAPKMRCARRPSRGASARYGRAIRE